MYRQLIFPLREKVKFAARRDLEDVARVLHFPLGEFTNFSFLSCPFGPRED